MKKLNNASLPLSFAGGKYSTESVNLPDGQYIVKIIATGPCIGKVLNGSEVLAEVDFSSYKLLSYNDLRISFILASESAISLEVTPKREDIKVYSASLSSSILPVGVDEYPTPTGTIHITANGENIDVKQYAKANVNVEEPLKVTYWKANNNTWVHGVESCYIMPMAAPPNSSEIQVAFYFNRDIDETTVNKDNFVIVANSGGQTDYTITYPTSNSILVKIPFSSKSADPYDDGYDVSFNGKYFTSIHGDLARTPIAISTDPANTLNAADYTYKYDNTMSYRISSSSSLLYISFIFDPKWESITEVALSNIYALVKGSINIPCEMTESKGNAIVLVFPVNGLSSGTYEVTYKGETCFPISIELY